MEWFFAHCAAIVKEDYRSIERCKSQLLSVCLTIEKLENEQNKRERQNYLVNPSYSVNCLPNPSSEPKYGKS